VAQQCVPDCEFAEVVIKTLGDQVTNVPLFKVGGQGLFIKEIEQALLEGRIDVAVHSLKDMPHAMSPGLSILAAGCLEDARDCFVSLKHESFVALPAGAVIGTSSLRRRAQLSSLRQDLQFSDFRGNLDTRLKKLEEGEVDAIILAAAGIHRFGWQQRIRHYFSIEEMTPPAGQGIIAIQCRSTDVARFLPVFASFADPIAAARAEAERAFLGVLQGGCTTPMAVHAEIAGDAVILHSFVGAVDGTRVIRNCHTGKVAQAAELGRISAEAMLAAGAADLIGAPHE
jgi:hydroxymethylbilane synthase